MHLSWISPRSDYHNGVLTGYDVLVNGSKHLTTDADSTSLDIHKLKTSTSYTFEVYAVTKAGRGSQAAMKQLTLEGKFNGVFSACCVCMLYSLFLKCGGHLFV